jgi:hypothetical protein
MTYSSTLALAINESTMRFLYMGAISYEIGVCEDRGAYTWLRERESGERWKASDDGAGMTERVEGKVRRERSGVGSI